jgi:hypothetical protein
LTCKYNSPNYVFCVPEAASLKINMSKPGQLHQFLVGSKSKSKSKSTSNKKHKNILVQQYIKSLQYNYTKKHSLCLPHYGPNNINYCKGSYKTTFMGCISIFTANRVAIHEKLSKSPYKNNSV